MTAEPPSHCDTQEKTLLPISKASQGMVLPLVETIALSSFVWPSDSTYLDVCCGVPELENLSLNLVITYVTLGKSLNLSGPHLRNRESQRCAEES